ncbi:hypothetical protein [Comamonas sp. JC664]|uniref:hypothetical protein n=1 Tax=Comamonas sp. JC664 TaxID=2801917 RepID=UPI0036169469
MNEGLAGGTEGLFSSDAYGTSKLDILTAHGEISARGQWGSLPHVMTLGAEWVEQKLNDSNSVSQTTTEAGSVPGVDNTGRSGKISSRIASLFVEDNIELNARTLLTPGLRPGPAQRGWHPTGARRSTCRTT